MLRVRVWDQIGDVFGKWELDGLSSKCRDANLINKAVALACCPDDDCPGFGECDWKVVNQGTVGPFFLFEARSGRNHLCLVLVNSEEQEDDGSVDDGSQCDPDFIRPGFCSAADLAHSDPSIHILDLVHYDEQDDECVEDG